MSSSPQSVRSLSKKAATPEKRAIHCPTCGKAGMILSESDYTSLDGFVFRHIKRLLCRSCGENLFSPADLAEMRRQRGK